jgi:predicted ester cyclase
MATVPEHVEHDEVVEQIRRDVDQGEHDAIRELWKKHSIAEDQRDLPGLMSTLTEDCVYELRPDGVRWEVHAGATRFYTELLTAFPDIHFDLTDIVIGPQGVSEWARVSGTHQNRWLDYEPTGEQLLWNVVILFPWDRERRLFTGEKVYSDASLTQALMR